MSSNVDPILQEKALTKLDNLKAKAELDDFDALVTKLFAMKSPADKEVTSKEELKSLITAIKQGTADNNRMAKFIGFANKILAKL